MKAIHTKSPTLGPGYFGFGDSSKRTVKHAPESYPDHTYYSLWKSRGEEFLTMLFIQVGIVKSELNPLVHIICYFHFIYFTHIYIYVYVFHLHFNISQSLVHKISRLWAKYDPRCHQKITHRSIFGMWQPATHCGTRSCSHMLGCSRSR